MLNNIKNTSLYYFLWLLYIDIIYYNKMTL